jgi:maleate cis-trans isomerase
VEKIVASARNMDLAGVDAILVPDTAMPGFRTKLAVEEVCKRPTITANQVTIWEALRLCGQSSLAVEFTTIQDPRCEI